MLEHGWALLGDAVEVGRLAEPEAAERLRQIVPGQLDSRPWGVIMRYYQASEVAMLIGQILDELTRYTDGDQRALAEHEAEVLAFVPRLVTSWTEGDRQVHTLANIVHPFAVLGDFLQDVGRAARRRRRCTRPLVGKVTVRRGGRVTSLRSNRNVVRCVMPSGSEHRGGELHMPVLRLVLLSAGILGLLGGTTQSVPVGTLKQYRVPTPAASRGTSPSARTGTSGSPRAPVLPAAIGRITPADVTEFPVGNATPASSTTSSRDRPTSCTSRRTRPSSGASPRRVTSLDSRADADTDVLAGSLAAHGDDIWITDFNNNSVWRYDIPTGQFTQFVVSSPAATPFDVAVDSSGIVWFTESGQPHRPARPADRCRHRHPRTTGPPRGIAIASDGRSGSPCASPRRPSGGSTRPTNA